MTGEPSRHHRTPIKFEDPLYLTPLTKDVIAEVLAHHARRSAAASTATTVQNDRPSAPSYRPEALNILFGEGTA